MKFPNSLIYRFNIFDFNLQIFNKGSKAIIWNYDIYGFDSGLTRQFCDRFAREGFLVILPDYLRGDFIVQG